jgi:hypothetical protein
VPEFVQNIISVRFLEVLDELIDKRIVESAADFCKKIDYTPQSLSAIRSGKRDVTVDLISKLLTVYNGNPLYVLNGRGPKLVSPEILTMVEEERVFYPSKSDERSTVQTLEKLVETKNEVILLLKREVSRLEEQLKKGANPR